VRRQRDYAIMHGMASRNRDKPIVIVGGGICGGNAAVTLRQEGFDGRVLLVAPEPGVPFGRPPLSKAYLRSEEQLDGWLVEPPDWYDEHDVELLRSHVAEVDANARLVVLDSGEELEFHKLLIATGGINRRLDIPGAELAGIHQLRTVAECEAIKREAGEHRRAVVVGMGFIGCEVAASLTELGVRVTTVFGGKFPLERVLGSEVGGAFAAIHEEHGVDLLSDEQLVSFEGEGRVDAAVTANGRRVECDFAVVGIGIEPHVPPFKTGSIEQSNGVLVDELCRTSAPDIYAAGDLANILHPVFGRVRVEHYNNAEKQGRAVARSMLGASDPYDYIYTFWSDQYEDKLEYAGYATKWDQFVVRGSLEERMFVGFYVVDGAVAAAVGLNRGGDPELDEDSEMAAAARLVGLRARADADVLANEDVDLWSLAR
jgi:3-phenylpropionate/trans-cinnamate dioxygenase ferredoxin reductase component